jgi:hypothetical protein
MIRVVMTGLHFVLIFLFLTLGMGCGTTKSLYRSVMPDGETRLKKRIWVMPPLDQGGVGEKKIEEITAKLTEELEENSHFLVYKGTKISSSSQIILNHRSVFILDPALLKSADEMGINVLIVAALNPFESETRRRGIWPFRRTRQEVDISLLVNAVDVIDGSFFLTHLVTKKKKISSEPTEKASIKKTELDEALAEILQDQAAVIGDKLRDHPWRGKITLADPEGLLINAGKDIGLETGQVFEVFARGASIRSMNGRDFPLLGPKVGEIETVTVMDSTAKAGPLTGGPFESGQVIREKK